MSLLTTARMYLKPAERLAESSDLYRHRVRLLDGGDLDLWRWRGRPTLVVNTASKCGFTPQYAGLQALWDRYRDDGLHVLGCPSADFAGQEFDGADEIGEFCERNYGVSFPLTERMSVRADPAPLWRDLIRQPGSKPPGWNFTKYLIGSDGHLIARFSTRTAPEDPAITGAIEQALAARAA